MKPVTAPTRIAFKNLLLATDLSADSRAALTWAESIARRYGSKLFVTHVVSPSETAMVPPEYWGSSQQLIETVARRELDALDASLDGLAHETNLEHGGLVEVVRDEVGLLDIDLLVVGTHGREGISRLTLGSAAEELLRQVRCPVLTVGPGVAPLASAEMKLDRILFATTFGQESLAAVPYAVSLAEEYQSGLIFLNVMNEDDFDLPVDPQVALKAHMERLRKIVPADAQLRHEPECILEFGKAGEQILRVARERNANLIVLGAKPASAHLGAATHMLSTTAHKVISSACCPVLTVCG